MKNRTPPIQYFNDHFYLIEQEELREIHGGSPPSEGFIRFMNGMEDSFLGVIGRQKEAKNDLEIHLIYAEYTKEFMCIAVSVPIEDYQIADDITGIFVGRIISLNPDKDFFSLYNTFQFHRVTALESMGYFTYNPLTAPRDATLISIQKIVPVPILNRVDILKDLYKDSIDKSYLDAENKIYLMVDSITGLIKIGKSKSPKYREGTLQSKKPETYLIVFWTAPAAIEKELHKKFASKRKRGEWFNLSIPDHYEVKAYMDAL